MHHPSGTHTITRPVPPTFGANDGMPWAEQCPLNRWAERSAYVIPGARISVYQPWFYARASGNSRRDCDSPTATLPARSVTPSKNRVFGTSTWALDLGVLGLARRSDVSCYWKAPRPLGRPFAGLRVLRAQRAHMDVSQSPQLVVLLDVIFGFLLRLCERTRMWRRRVPERAGTASEGGESHR